MDRGYVDHPQELTVLSLCAGYGGLELGLARALANPLRVVAVEIEAFALANLEAKAAQGALAIDALWPDLRSFPAERFRGCFDFVIAGYPCQPHSCSGRRQGKHADRWLWPDIARCVGGVQPEFVFFENVAGHLSSAFDRVLGDLEALRYCLAPGLFTALEAGVSIEHGKRLFLLGQTTDRRRARARLSIRPGRQDQAETDAGRPGAMVGPTDGVGFPDVRREPQSAVGWGGAQVAPQGIYQHPWEAQRYVEPGVGEPIDGVAGGVVRSRVDQLRLVGNGVVPAQADLAFRTLRERLNDA